MDYCKYCGANITGLLQHCDICGAPINTINKMIICHYYVDSLSGDLPRYFDKLVDLMNKESEKITFKLNQKIIFEVYCYPQTMLGALTSTKSNIRYYSKDARIVVKKYMDYETYVHLDAPEKNKMVIDFIESSFIEMIDKCK